METSGFTGRRIAVILFPVLFLLVAVTAINVKASQKIWVISTGAELKADKSGLSKTVKVLSRGAEAELLSMAGSWYNIRLTTGEQGWMYRGKLSTTKPEQLQASESDNLFSPLSGSLVKADEADTSRSIRSFKKNEYAVNKNAGDMEKSKEALALLLSINFTEADLDSFLKEGHIGEYAQ